MTNLDSDKLELIERQLAERVTERVHPALFRLYATVGVAVIGALGFVSWDIVEDIKSEIKAEVTSVIDKEIKAKRIQILEQVTETRILARRVNKVIQRLEEQLTDFEPQAQHLGDTIKNLDETSKKVNILKITSQNLIATYSQEVKPLVLNVESLTSQLRTLAEQVEQLNINAKTSELDIDKNSIQKSQQRSAAIQSIISSTIKADKLAEQALNKTTVFFQFAGGQRKQAEEFSAALKEKGYYIPGEDREAGAAGKHQIRYFHDEDKERAELLANDANDTLSIFEYSNTVGNTKNIKAVSFVSYKGKKPRVGVLELWLEVPPIKGEY